MRVKLLCVRESMIKTHNKYIAFFFILVCLVVVSACEQTKKRPYGYIRLGAVEALRVPATFREDLRLLVKYDAQGFSVMSTMCTYDLTPLTRVRVGQNFLFQSVYTTSRYDGTGVVLQGPTTEELPHYHLVLARASVNGPLDTLYVRVGVEVPADWRLKIPLRDTPQKTGMNFLKEMSGS